MAFSPTALQKARLARGWTREELAVMVRCSPASVSRWESADRVPDPVNQLRIAKALRITVEDLNPESDPQPVSAA